MVREGGPLPERREGVGTRDGDLGERGVLESQVPHVVRPEPTPAVNLFPIAI